LRLVDWRGYLVALSLGIKLSRLAMTKEVFG
jgi:hypothetical protein